MAKALTKNAAIYSANIDERNFVKARIHYDQSNPNIIILGSSRIMQVGNHNASSKVLNLAVSGASIEDDIAIWFLASKKFNPKFVFISGDPWLFNAKSGQNRWEALREDYVLALEELNVEVKTLKGSSQANSSGNTFFSDFYNAVNISNVVANDDSPSLLDKIRKDGSRVYNLSYANQSISEIERGINQFMSYGMAEYTHSEEAKKIFEEFISSLSTNHDVVIVLTPYHPKLYELMKTQNKMFLNIEDGFKEISSRLNIKLIGSYDPAKIGCDESEFFDGMHPKDSCMKKIISQLKSKQVSIEQ